ncbi:MAG: S9 family peptidase [Candidatus Riflebacteria bacterium]
MPKKLAKARNISIEDLKNFIGVGDPQISPDGSRIVFSRSFTSDKNKVCRSLWLACVKTGKLMQFTSGESDRSARWSPDGSRIVFVRTDKEGLSQFWIIDVNGGEARALSKLPEGAIADLKWSPDGKSIAFRFRPTEEDLTKAAQKQREEKGLSTPPMVIDQIWYRLDGDGYFNRQRFQLYLLDADNGSHRILFDKAPDGPGAYSWSPDSRQLAVIANLEKEPMINPTRAWIYLVDAGNGRHKPLAGRKDCGLSNLAWSPDGKSIAFTGRIGKVAVWSSKNDLLFIYDLKKNSYKCLTEKEDFCLGATIIGDTAEAVFGTFLLWSHDSRHIYCNFGWHGDRHISRIAATGGKFEFLTSGTGTFSLGNLSLKGEMALVAGNPLNPGDLYFGNLKGAKLSLKKLTLFNDEFISSLNLVKPEPVWVKTADGNQVQLWEMKPIGFKPGKKYPAVLEIHGGPHALYGNTFFHEFQVLAANGYVVYFSNPRGSKGYGEKHCDAIAGNWGDKDWIDMQAVITHIRKQKFVDNARMGVMGGSYGGYMTNWIIGHTDEFAGAITDRCVFNMLSMMGSSDFVTMPDNYWPGNWWDRIDDFWRQSPLKYFGNVKTPTLVIHSEGDLRCNVEQAEQVFTLLKIRGIPTRLVRYPRNTSHGMSRSGPADLRIHRLGQILDWWKTWLK